MNIFIVIGLVGIGMVVFTSIFALTISRLSIAVTNNYEEIEKDKVRYKPAQTFGFKISQVGSKDEQYKDAQRLAAKAAAQLPRGANMRIGSKGKETLKTTSQNLKNDPISSFKIATTQGWNGLGDFSKLQGAATAVAAAPVAVTQTKVVKRKLVPGKDFEVVAITADMAPADKRRARIANSKSKSAAYKALKESGQDMVTQAAPVAAAVPAAAAAPSSADLAAAAGIAEPTYIEITDDMDSAAKRKARIENSKMKSAYKKAMKAAGIDPSAAAAAPPPPPPAPAAVAAPPVDTAPAVEIPSDIPKPDLIEITDDMDSAAKRAARIANSKAKSAYKKALKEAGIDPKSVKI